MTACIKKVAKEVLKEMKGIWHAPRETWWWDDEVQVAIKSKKACLKTSQRSKEVEDLTRYKLARNKVEKIVGKARAKKYDDLYNSLNSKDGEKAIYKMAKVRERMTRDLDHVRCIKSEDGRVLIKNEDIEGRWKEYFYVLLTPRVIGLQKAILFKGTPLCVDIYTKLGCLK
ncbi:uncharacterized protein LOC122671154 [Telopea speciosissima]|uniref:uncharacterized protein LOC122671154 n=1 Tax=Telopea speciosissima TaxID=54955 RepID=UPI001CC4F4F1|nr:uncharacterized protein LOC122671154 [Telopea speciosissima]